MNLENIKRRALVSWASVGVLAALCLVLAAMQYVWLGEISRAERARLQVGLQSSAQRLAQDFNAEISAALTAVRPPVDAIQDAGRDNAYAAQWLRWRESVGQPAVFRRNGLAVPEGDSIRLLLFDEAKEKFVPADWPKDWEGMRDGLLSRWRDRRFGPLVDSNPMLVETPRFGRHDGEPGPGRELEWLIVELDADFLRSSYLPTLLARHIGTGVPLHVQIHDRFDAAKSIFASGTPSAQPPDVSVSLLDVFRFDPPQRRGGARQDRGRGQRGASAPPDFNRGRWQLDVRYGEGSLDSIVARIRWRNLGISAAILALMLLTAVLLVRFSRQQHELAEQQMNFVAGVSHELRTPLTVIRTAAFNLRGKVAANPAQVERYGALIQDQSEKLTALVEQVLRFSSARAGHAIGERCPVAIRRVIEDALGSRNLAADGAQPPVEKTFDDWLPLVMADELALKHAIQNLLENAVKYGAGDSNWIGVSARKVTDRKGDAVEVRVMDHGLGIPPDERPSIFDPFFRGKRAQQDQIHGTGLGLNLVKKIVESHGGSIRVESEPGQGAAFIMRIPAAPAELQDELANTAG